MTSNTNSISIIPKLCGEDFSQALAGNKVITTDLQAKSRGIFTWFFCRQNAGMVNSLTIAQNIQSTFQTAIPSLTNKQMCIKNITALKQMFTQKLDTHSEKFKALEVLFTNILSVVNQSGQAKTPVNQNYGVKSKKPRDKTPSASLQPAPVAPRALPQLSTLSPSINTHQNDLKKLKETHGFEAQEQLVLAISAWQKGESRTCSDSILALDFEKIAKLEAGVPEAIRREGAGIRTLLYFSNERKYYYNVLVKKPDQGGMPDYGFIRVEAKAINHVVREHTSDQFDLGAHLKSKMREMGLRYQEQ